MSVRFGPPQHDTAPYLTLGLPLPCNLCAHDVRDHDYLYTLGELDIYRCRKLACPCGAKSEVLGMKLAADATPEQAEAAMAALAAGHGVPVRIAPTKPAP